MEQRSNTEWGQDMPARDAQGLPINRNEQTPGASGGVQPNYMSNLGFSQENETMDVEGDREREMGQDYTSGQQNTNNPLNDQLRAEGRPNDQFGVSQRPFANYNANTTSQAASSYFNPLSGGKDQQGFASSSTQPLLKPRPVYNEQIVSDSSYQQQGRPLLIPNAVPTYGVAQPAFQQQQQQQPPLQPQQQHAGVDYTLPSVMDNKSAGPPPVAPNVILPEQLPPAGPDRPIPSRGRRASIGQLY